MAKNKSGNVRVYLDILLTIVSCVLACSNIISNNYLKLLIVMCLLGFGLFGIMKKLSSPETSTDIPEEKK